ncbi:MAG: acyl-CoA desaturase [Proteobacteria bacterium]|nr:acyl-CoA desaturase [Pseudomonadota bacterium]
MYLKSVILLLWFGASYAGLVFGAKTGWQAVLLGFSLALAMAGISFAVQHDANHGAYSKHSAVNRLMGLTLDLLGASSYIWQWKHNIAHHTYTGLNGADSDIDVPFGRLSPAQPYQPLHRFQHVYLWPIYGFFVANWQLVQDFRQLAEARIATNRFPRPRRWRLVELVGGKLVFFGWALVLPACLHPWWTVLLGYAAIAALLSFVLVLVFQLAHSVEEASLPPLAPGTRQVPRSWAVHQVQATVDFARGNRLLGWYLGGLNFQIEHHLFPRVCHVHYPRIAGIVEQTCREFGVRYVANDTFFGALASHWRWLRRMGRPPEAATPALDASPGGAA